MNFVRANTAARATRAAHLLYEFLCERLHKHWVGFLCCLGVFLFLSGCATTFPPRLEKADTFDPRLESAKLALNPRIEPVCTLGADQYCIAYLQSALRAAENDKALALSRLP